MGVVYSKNAELMGVANRVIKAIDELTAKGISIINIEFTKLQPVISVAHCAGTRRLISVIYERAQDNDEVKFVRKISHIHNCAVIWEEVES